jgi:hypothetical protein
MDIRLQPGRPVGAGELAVVPGPGSDTIARRNVNFVGQPPDLTGIVVDVTYRDPVTRREWMERVTDTSLFYTDPPTIMRADATNMLFSAPDTAELHPVTRYRLRHVNGGPYAANDLRLQVIRGLDTQNSNVATGTDGSGTASTTFASEGWYEGSVRPIPGASLTVPLLEDAFIEDLSGANIRIRYAPLDLRPGTVTPGTGFFVPFTAAATGYFAEIVEEHTVQLTRQQLNRNRALGVSRWEGIEFPSSDARRGEAVITGAIRWAATANPNFNAIPAVGTGAGTRTLPNVWFLLRDEEVATRTDINGGSIAHLATIFPVGEHQLQIAIPAELWYVTEVRPYRLPVWPDYFQYGRHGTTDDFDVIEPFRRGLQMEVLYARPLPAGHPWGPRRIVGIDHINTLNFMGALSASPSDNPFAPDSSVVTPNDRLRRLTAVPLGDGPNFNADSVDELMLRLAYFSDQSITAGTTDSIHGFTNQLIGVQVPVYELEGELEFRPKAGTRPDHIITVHGSATGATLGTMPYEVIEAVMTYYDLVFVYARGRGEEPVVFNFNRLVWDSTVVGQTDANQADRAPNRTLWNRVNIRNPPGTENIEMGVTITFPAVFTPAFNQVLRDLRDDLVPQPAITTIANRTIEPRRGINFLNQTEINALASRPAGERIGANRAFQALRLTAELPVEVLILPVR